MNLSSKLSFGLYPKLRKRLSDESGGVQYVTDSKEMFHSSSRRSSFESPIRPVFEDVIVPAIECLSSSVPTKPSKISLKATNYLKRTYSTIAVSKSPSISSPRLLQRTKSSDDTKNQIIQNEALIPLPLPKSKVDVVEKDINTNLNIDSLKPLLTSDKLLIPENYDLTKTTSRQSQFSSATTFTDAQSVQLRIVYDNSMIPGFMAPR